MRGNSTGGEGIRSGSPEAADEVEMTTSKLSKKKILKRVGREMERASQRERRTSRANVVTSMSSP